VSSQRLRTYLLTVGTTGIASAAAVLWTGRDAFDLDLRPEVVLPLVLVLMLGEVFPIVVSREEQTDEVSISSTVGLALVFVAPIGIVLVAQSLGLIIDEVVRGARGQRQRGPLLPRVTFNIGQYALAFLAARGAFSVVAGEPLSSGTTDFRPGMLPAAWLGAAAFYVVNSLLTSGAFALNNNNTLQHQLREDLPWQVASSAMLLGLAPVYAQASLWSPWMLPFLLFPLIVVHRSAADAAKRGAEALHDSLTGLPNRGMLQLQLRKRLDDPGSPRAALLLMDLDHFKDVNDTLGHHVGDMLIRAVGDRVAGVLGEDDLLARLGGDEFAIVTHYDGRVTGVQATASAIIQALAQPLSVDGISLHVGCSVGVALAPEHGDTVDLLLQRADVALYAAKETRGGYAVYDPERDTHSEQRLVLAEDLRRSLNARDIDIAFQVQVHARTRDVVAVEALVRWSHPLIGTVDPERVISLASSTGLLGELTDQVLERGLDALHRWEELGHVLRLAVNLTARQLADTALPGRIADLLAAHGTHPSRLTLEVTEVTLMTDPARSLRVVQALKDLGVELSIDDFGTGWSSLAHLQRIAPHEIKIDRSFVIPMVGSEPDRTIVRSTLELGHNLGMRVVAEGVEDEATAALLAGWGCDLLQGYAFSTPRDEVAITRLLERWPGREAPLQILAPGTPVR
jgi:diguanylate cyclase (GGDEF)-like protein